MRPLVDFGLVVLIWLVQLVVYPSFRDLNAEEFRLGHGRYRTLISYFVVPLMFGQIWLVGRQALATHSTLDVASALLVASAWLAAFTLSVPCHQALSQAGKDTAVIDRSWRRTGCARSPGRRSSFWVRGEGA